MRRCFVVELREPAARIEAWFKECDWVQKSGTLDEFFEKSMLGDNPHTSERTFPVITYFRNYSGVELPFNGGSVAPADIHKKESLLWGAVQWYDHPPPSPAKPVSPSTSLNAPF